MNLRSAFCLTAILALAVPAQAAIILELGPETALNGGLISRTVTATGTAGETIAGFDAINLSNAHQVWGLGNVVTLRDGQDPGFGWNAEWAAYDSRLLHPTTDYVGSVGAPLNETNDLSTTGTLGLPMEFGQNPPSGFGTIASADGTDGFRLLPGLQGPSVAFLQVVTTPMTALLDVAVGFFPPDSTAGQTSRIQGFEIGGEGGGDETDPPVISLADYGIYHIDEDPDPLWIDLLAQDESPPISWSGLQYDSGPGKNTDTTGQDDGTLDPTGVFHWDPRGWRQGEHFFSATATDSLGNSSSGVAVRVDLWVPEPATASLMALALVGLAGFTRRRS